jgi:hypothetical protein
MNKKYDNNNIIIASRAYFLQVRQLYSDITCHSAAPATRDKIDDLTGGRAVRGLASLHVSLIISTKR